MIRYHTALERTTNGEGELLRAFLNDHELISASAGLIREHSWYGPDGMEHLRTTKKPQQSIPTFVETVALLMKVWLFPLAR